MSDVLFAWVSQARFGLLSSTRIPRLPGGDHKKQNSASSCVAGRVARDFLIEQLTTASGGKAPSQNLVEDWSRVWGRVLTAGEQTWWTNRGVFLATN